MPGAAQPTTTGDLATSVPSGATVLTALRGDPSAFAALAEQYRRQLQVHCYRMLGSVDDADEVVQETFLNA
jgi:RNA polymerase sigma-70 factor (ECF subfamily)